MLVYKEYNIGTAKPTAEELKEVRHDLVNVISVKEEFDVTQFLKRADEVNKFHKGKILGVGGTPFYIQALRYGLSQLEKLEGVGLYLEGFETSKLKRWLIELDPKRASEIHDNDRFRLVRALEIIFSSGKKSSSFKPMGKTRDNCNLKLIALNAPREIMHEKLKARLDHMFSKGLLEEAREIYENNQPGRSAGAAVGYKELFSHFKGETSLEEAKEKILVSTRRLYKHQMTWLRKMPVDWIEYDGYDIEPAYEKFENIAKDYFF